MKERLKKLLAKKCKHEWVLEEPTFNIGNSFKIWEGVIYDHCRKCGAQRPHPECKHRWQPTDDDGNGPIINNVKYIRASVCKRCGAFQYKAPK